MKISKPILVFFLVLSFFGTAFSQHIQVGIHVGGVVVQDLDTYLETLIPGPYFGYDFNSGYVFYEKSFESKANIHLGVSLEFPSKNWFSPFVKFSYFSLTSNGECSVNLGYFGGILERSTPFEIKTSLYNAQIGTNICIPVGRLIAFVAAKVIYNQTSHQRLEFEYATADFRKYAYLISYDSVNNTGLGFGVGVKIPITQKFMLAPTVEYDNLGLINSGEDDALAYYHYSIGFLYQL